MSIEIRTKKSSPKTESEELALFVAIKAARKVFPSHGYKYHGKEVFMTVWGRESVNGIPNPLPENAEIWQTMWVKFHGTACHFLLVRLSGFSSEGKIIWNVSWVCAPGLDESVLNEEELASLLEDFRKRKGKEGQRCLYHKK